MNILVIDNFDSFTYNLVHYIEDVTGKLPDVYRNNQISIEEVAHYDALVLSPGPGLPDEAGILKPVIQRYAGKMPILGVCLGLQAIVEVFGGELENLEQVYHGVVGTMTQTESQSILFTDIPQSFDVGRYHSWSASKNNFPQNLEITCVDNDGVIMGVKHKDYFIEAVQFHPESILSPQGKQMIRNFIAAVEQNLAKK